MHKIREIDVAEIAERVRDLFLLANTELGEDLCCSLRSACENESNARASCVLRRLEENLAVARERAVPICQDTGMAIAFVDIGADVHITGGTLQSAFDAGVRAAYLEGGMRCSIVRDPLYHRENTGDNTPALLHIRQVSGDRIRIIAAPKGFGSENMSALKMFTPAATDEDILNFVCETVKQAGANPCPPIVVGIGLGSDFEGVATLAKRALLRETGSHHADPLYADLEKRILRAVNSLGIGPQGFGGDTTALSVHIETAPTHIAGLPCGVNICCHVCRHREIII